MAKAECIAERNGVDGRATVTRADDLPGCDGDNRCGEGNCQVLEMHRGGGRLWVGVEAGETVAARFHNAARADSNKVGRHEAAGLLRSLCVEPLVFDLQDLRSRSTLRCRSGGAEQRQGGER